MRTAFSQLFGRRVARRMVNDPAREHCPAAIRDENASLRDRLSVRDPHYGPRVEEFAAIEALRVPYYDGSWKEPASPMERRPSRIKAMILGKEEAKMETISYTGPEASVDIGRAPDRTGRPAAAGRCASGSTAREDRLYSWLEDHLSRLEGKEARAEYYGRL